MSHWLAIDCAARERRGAGRRASSVVPAHAAVRASCRRWLVVSRRILLDRLRGYAGGRAMAATARREIDTGEEDIAAIAKQISDHAEAIYQTWKARGLAPTEILSCRPTPGLKLAESLRTKPKPEPKPEIKQRPEFRRERPEVRREQRDPRREQREPEADAMNLPPDLVPERNGSGGAGNSRRSDTAAMRLEVAREEERLLRALRTGGVVAERPAERPDVVPPISLVDYAKSRYQDRLDTGARKPAAGASGERRASLGSHVTEARSKFEARARRASSASAAESGSAPGQSPVRPFLTRGSVAERVLMFERCPSEATLELAKRKSPVATTWRGPHDVINRAQATLPLVSFGDPNLGWIRPAMVQSRVERLFTSIVLKNSVPNITSRLADAQRGTA
ncbi:unnamed protein product [Leptosia nina]|uniref:Uncharacterized protein n=1 Tax=Leptosia nina TaxID=320188 RepID=A0AAV1JHI1_9NEOP